MSISNAFQKWYSKISDQFRPPVTGSLAADKSQHPPPVADPICHYRKYPNAGTSNRYNPPPPPQGSHNNTNPHNADPDAAGQCTLFNILKNAVLIACYVAAIIIWVIMFLKYRPRYPDFQVVSVTLSNFNVSDDSMVTGNWDVRFTVQNPNSWITLSYYAIEAGILYRSDTLTETAVPPFVQGKKNETAVRAKFAAASTYLAQPYVDEIKSNRTGGGSVSFNVVMDARVRFKARRLPAWSMSFKFHCEDLQVGVSANGTGGSLLGGARECWFGDD